MGVQSVTNFIDMANSYTYATAYNNARISDGNQPAFQPAIIDHFKNHDNPLLYPDIDWIDYVMKDRALQSQHNISVSVVTRWHAISCQLVSSTKMVCSVLSTRILTPTSHTNVTTTVLTWTFL